MTPQEIARKLAAHYRAFPHLWKRGKMGSLEGGCCMMGGALELVDNSPSLVSSFCNVFRQMFGMAVTNFNDNQARDVKEVIAALDKLAANDAGA